MLQSESQSENIINNTSHRVQDSLKMAMYLVISTTAIYL